MTAEKLKFHEIFETAISGALTSFTVPWERLHENLDALGIAEARNEVSDFWCKTLHAPQAASVYLLKFIKA